MRVAFVSASNGCMLKSEYTESRKSANRPRRHTIALPHSRRLCAAAGSLPPPLLDARKSVPSTARANKCASIFGTGYRGSANGPRRHTIALPHSHRLCAAAGSLPPPLLDARKSVPSTARANMCASIFGTGYRGSANRPRRRAIALPHSRRLCAAAGSLPPPLLDARKSVPWTNRPRQHACKASV